MPRVNDLPTVGVTAGYPTSFATTDEVVALQSGVVVKGAMSLLPFAQSGTGAVTQTVEGAFRRLPFVNLLDFCSDAKRTTILAGTQTDVTAELALAAATGRPIWGPYGQYELSSPVTVSSNMLFEGRDTNQSTFILTGTGRLVTGDEMCHWSGFTMKSEVNSLTFVKVSHSHFKFDHFSIETTAATGQIAFEWDTATSNGLAGCTLRDYRINHIDYPHLITGDDFFNGNHLGGFGDIINDFLSTIRVETSGIVGANEIGGYVESGTNFLTVTAGTVRDNTITAWLDSVTNAINASVAIGHNHWPYLPPESYVTTGVGTVAIQTFAEKIKFRAYLVTSDQTINDNTDTKIAFNAETFDTDATFASNKFTAPRAMKLLVTAQADISGNLANGDRTTLSVYIDGVLFNQAKEYVSGGTNGARPQVTDIIDLAKSSYVEIFALADETAGANTHTISASQALTYFAGTEL